MANLIDSKVNGDLRVTGTVFGTHAGNYAACSTAAATVAKEVSISGFSLTAGSHVYIKFANTNTGAVASLTLNVSGTGAKAIKYRGGNLPSAGVLAAGRVYEFVYDGTNWEAVGDFNTDAGDTRVKLTDKSSDTGSYPMVIAANASPTSGSSYEGYFDTNVKLTPSTNTISANISGTAETANNYSNDGGIATALSGKADSSHSHGNIANGGTLTDTAAAAAGNDFVVIRDADNAKIQTSTIKGTDVASAVSSKHTHSTLTLSTTAQAYDGTHTLALPASDPYTSARTPESHTHGNISNDGKIGSTANLPVVTGTSGAVTTGSFSTSATAVATSSTAGSANTFSRGDHTHSISLATGDSEGQVKIAGSNVSVNGWDGKLSKAGDTMTGRLTMEKAINQVIIGTGTAATSTTSGSTTTYYPALWTYNLSMANPTPGDRFVIKTPVAGSDWGTYISTDNGTTYYPVARNTGASRLTNQYPAGAYVCVVFEEYVSGSSAAGQVNDVFPVEGSTTRVSQKIGCWRVINDYDSGNTVSAIRTENGRFRTGSTGCNPYALVCLDKDGTFSMLTSSGSGTGTSKTINTSGKFKLDAVILWYNANNTTAANSIVSSTYVTYNIYHAVDTRYSHNHTTTFTTNAPLYIECTIDEDGFWSPTTTCITQTLTSGKYYIFLGMTYSTEYQLSLMANHPLYYYDGTNLTEVPRLSKADRTKLDGIASGATKVESSSTNGSIKINGTDTTVYTHPTTSGNNHIPSGGSSGQFLGWDSDGTAKWVSNPNSDTKVKATAKTDNVNYKILATASASPTSGNATEAVYDTDITLNPSTNTIAANISGTAAKPAVTLLTAQSSSLIMYKGSTAGDVLWYRWAESSVPSDAPLADTSALMCVQRITDDEIRQTVYCGSGQIFTRKNVDDMWDYNWSDLGGVTPENYSTGVIFGTSSNTKYYKLATVRSALAQDATTTSVFLIDRLTNNDSKQDLGYLVISSTCTDETTPKFSFEASLVMISDNVTKAQIKLFGDKSTGLVDIYAFGTALLTANDTGHVGARGILVTVLDVSAGIGNFVTFSPTGAIAENAPTGLTAISLIKSTHTHSADDITSGTLPVSRGGTGLTTTANTNAVIIGNSSNAAGSLQAVAAASGAFFSTGTNVKPKFGTLPVAQGGTGLTSSPSMLVNLGSTTAANVMASSPRPGVTGTLEVGNGGTGATTAADARTSLGAQETLPTTGTASSTYAINISGSSASCTGNASTATTAQDYDTSTGTIKTALDGKQADIKIQLVEYGAVQYSDITAILTAGKIPAVVYSNALYICDGSVWTVDSVNEYRFTFASGNVDSPRIVFLKLRDSSAGWGGGVVTLASTSALSTKADASVVTTLSNNVAAHTTLFHSEVLDVTDGITRFLKISFSGRVGRCIAIIIISDGASDSTSAAFRLSWEYISSTPNGITGLGKEIFSCSDLSKPPLVYKDNDNFYIGVYTSQNRGATVSLMMTSENTSNVSFSTVTRAVATASDKTNVPLTWHAVMSDTANEIVVGSLGTTAKTIYFV